jgi:hypothetical protein
VTIVPIDTPPAASRALTALLRMTSGPERLT